MRSVGLIVVGGWLVSGALGCGSDDQPAGGGGGGSGGSTAGAQNAGAANGGTHAGAGGSASTTAGAGGTSATASKDCEKYCECHQNNCAPTAIPGGKSCADFCATFSAEQLTCRTAHCSLAPVQPNNNHCAHSVGTLECL